MSVFQGFMRIAPFVSLALLGGCATVTRGTTSEVQIQSEPSGAAVETSLNHKCTAPCTIKINRKEEFSVTFRLAGYEEQSIFVKTRVAGAGAAGLAGNVLIGGIVGIGVDAATGAILEHVPNPVVATMVRIGPAPKGKQKAAPKVKAAPPPKAEKPKPDRES